MLRWLAAPGLAVLFLGSALSSRALGQDPPGVQFSRDIRPILADKCFPCHGPDAHRREAELRLDQQASATGENRPFTPFDVAGSEALRRIASSDPEEHMPPPAAVKQLAVAETQLLRRWVAEGALWQGHWSFLTPQAPAVPDVERKAWPITPIDAFVLARLEREGLSPSPPADRETLLRRVTLDLTGLPPTVAEQQAFIQDAQPDAYQRLVDRLLASPRFGERMAQAWMDAARYGDTSVYHADGQRDMWAWRDWVIRAYNANMPFDQFTLEQMAGDLLPDATVAQRTATGFHRNHGTTDEGGAIDEEYRVEYIVDRVKTTATVWLGLTMECGQCHDHKYDPIPQQDYYRFFAYFNQSSDAGMQTRSGNAEPRLDIPNSDNEPILSAARRDLQANLQALQNREASIEPELQQWAAQPPADRPPAPRAPVDAAIHLPLDGNAAILEAANERTTQAIAAVDPSARVEAALQGSPAWVDGFLDGAIQLDGLSLLDAGDLANFSRHQAFSYGAWLYFDEPPTGAVLARMDDNAGFRGFDLFMSGGKAEVHLVHHWPENAIKVKTKNALPNQQWTHVLVTYNGSSQAAGVSIYFNGKSQAWDPEHDSLSDEIQTDKPLYIGRRHGAGSYRGRIDDVRVFTRRLTPQEAASLAAVDPIVEALRVPSQHRSAAVQRRLRRYYLEHLDPVHRALSAERQQLQQKIAELEKPLTSVMVLRDVPQQRTTYVLTRGHYASPDLSQPVQTGTPSALPPPPPDAPANRLGLALWLVAPQHPLTARVAVNRYWNMLYGSGLVGSVEDFGSQGEWPSHPQLLDWLAVDFMEHGWDIKRTWRHIVLSATYRQASRVRPELAQHDPENRLLGRSPRLRLSGEIIRDQALAAAGALVEQLGGPSVKPYQPPGIWNEVSLDGNVRFVQDHGAALFRRSLYTFWKRSAPAPSMQIFDAPTREKCVVRRARTNTPLQALVTLNDPQFVEAARLLAQRALLEPAVRPAERAAWMYRVAAGRTASPRMVQTLCDTYRWSLEQFRRAPERAQQLLATGEAPRDDQLEPAVHAAWTVVASMILNLDAVLTRS